jgi:hypothetical protein
MPGRHAPPLDRVAESYVRLALAIHRHDPRYVEACTGPRAWLREARRGRPVPPAVLAGRAAALLEAARACAPSDRREFLERQIAAAGFFAATRDGAGPGWDAELGGLYDLEPRPFDLDAAADAARRFAARLPGRGTLLDRRRRLDPHLRVPPARFGRIVRIAVAEMRRRTAAIVALPRGESVRVRLVRGRSWTAFSWYLGGRRSRIDINLDQAPALHALLDIVAHETYPGHHLLNTARDQVLARERGWIEHRVAVLFSPMAVISEGLAAAAVPLLMTDAEAADYLRDVLAPLAGVSPRAAEDGAVLATDAFRTHQLRVGVEAARRHALGRLSRRGAIALGARCGLTRGFVEAAVGFGAEYGPYMATYPVGKDLVLRFVGDGPDRGARLRALLVTPFTPAALARRAAGRP